MEPQQRPGDTGGPDDPAIDVDAEGDRQCQPANPRLEQIRAAMRLHLQTSADGVQVIDDDEVFRRVGAGRSLRLASNGPVQPSR